MSIRRYIYPAIVALAAVAAYINGIQNGFVYDDSVQVVKNYWITSPSYLRDIFTSGVWGFNRMPTNYYRPLMHISYMAVYHAAGLKPAAFHALNVLVHAGASVMVYAVTRLLLGDKGGTGFRAQFPALTAGLIFALHPIHTEAVDWVAGLPDLLMALFCLLSLYFYVRARKTPGSARQWYVTVSLASFMLAALSKEPALTLPLVFAAYDMSARDLPHGLAGYARRYGTYIAATAAYLALRVYALGGFAPNPAAGDIGFYAAALKAVLLLGMYIEKLVFPVDLNLYHALPPASGMALLAPAVLVAAFFAAMLTSLRKNRMVFFGLVAVLAALLPVLYLPGVGRNPFAERYLYLPSFGLSFLAALAAKKSISGARGVYPAAAVVAVVTVLFAAGTVARNPVWKDDLTLWSDVVSKSPSEPVPWNALGIAMDAAGRREDAASCYKEAVKLDPDMAEALVNLGNYYNRAGRLDEAEAQYKEAIVNGDSSIAHNNLGVVYARTGRYGLAVDEFRAAIKKDAKYVDAYRNLARAYKKMGMPKEEADALKDMSEAGSGGPVRSRIQEKITDGG